MEKLARKIANSLGKYQGSDDEQIAVMAYGLIGIIQLLAILAIVSIISIIFGFFIEAIIIFISVGLLRRVIGGAHSSGIYTCLIFSVAFICILAALSELVIPLYIPDMFQYYISAFCYIVSAILIYILAPDAPPNKPVRTEEKRRRLRKQSFWVLVVFILITANIAIINIYIHNIFSYGLALSLSVLWQSSMMTRAGHRFVQLLDKFAELVYSLCKSKANI